MTLVLPDLRFLLVNPAWVSMMGYTEDEFRKMSFKEITHPDNIEGDTKNIQDLAAGLIPVYSTEKQYIRKDGSTLWGSLKVTTVRNHDGTLRHFLAQIEDVTLRKQAEERVRESENKFATIFQSSPVALVLVSATDGTFVDVNDAFMRNTGYSRDEVIGTTSEALGIFADSNECNRLASAIKDRQIIHDIEIKCRIKTGEIRSCLFSSSLILIGGKPHIFSTITDITEHRNTDAAFRAMVTGMVGTTGVDSLRQITESVSSWLGAECVMVGEIQPDRQTVSVISMLLDGKNITDFSYTLKGTPCENVTDKGFCQYSDNVRQLFPESKDLAELNIRGYIGTSLRNSTGQVTGILCALFRNPVKTSPSTQEILNIIAVKAAAEIERRQDVEALRQANKKLNLLSSITRHDINNQILTLNGFVDLLQRENPDPSFEHYFSRITEASSQIAAMIKFTKEYEKIGVRAPVWQDIHTLVNHTGKDALRGQVTFKNDLPANTEVFADPLIVKVFFNLIDNAVRHGDKITTIRFSLEECEGNRILVCEDDGRGVATEEKEHIFDLGFGKNSGFGLAISREILNITGLSIKETGVPGKGARFEIMVPVGQHRSTPK
jgi:PAS domain S-box-containing protein